MEEIHHSQVCTVKSIDVVYKSNVNWGICQPSMFSKTCLFLGQHDRAFNYVVIREGQELDLDKPLIIDSYVHILVSDCEDVSYLQLQFHMFVQCSTLTSLQWKHL